MSNDFIINYKNHKACIQISEGDKVQYFKIIGVKNQSEKEKYEFLQTHGYEPREGFYFKTRKVLENDANGVGSGITKPKYEKKINYIFTNYV